MSEEIKALATPGTDNRLGWHLPAHMTQAEWCDAGRALGRAERTLSWCIGDWWAFGETRYGARKALVEAEEWEGPGFQAIADAAVVCRSFEASRRREVLSFKHHREVASLPPDRADALLD